MCGSIRAREISVGDKCGEREREREKERETERGREVLQVDTWTTVTREL